MTVSYQPRPQISARPIAVFALQRGAAVVAGAFGFATGFVSMVLVWQLI